MQCAAYYLNWIATTVSEWHLQIDKMTLHERTNAKKLSINSNPVYSKISLVFNAYK